MKQINLVFKLNFEENNKYIIDYYAIRREIRNLYITTSEQKFIDILKKGIFQTHNIINTIKQASFL